MTVSVQSKFKKICYNYLREFLHKKISILLNWFYNSPEIYGSCRKKANVQSKNDTNQMGGNWLVENCNEIVSHEKHVLLILFHLKNKNKKTAYGLNHWQSPKINKNSWNNSTEIFSWWKNAEKRDHKHVSHHCGRYFGCWLFTFPHFWVFIYWNFVCVTNCFFHGQMIFLSRHNHALHSKHTESN